MARSIHGKKYTCSLDKSLNVLKPVIDLIKEMFTQEKKKYHFY